MADSSKRRKSKNNDSQWFQSSGADADQLLSFEKLDRASPDLWPEQIPGVSEYAAEKMLSRDGSPPKWMADLENEDINLLQEFGSLTTKQLMEKVKGLQNLAYQLGLEEAREMTRGKYLNVLQNRRNERQAVLVLAGTPAIDSQTANKKWPTHWSPTGSL